MRWMLLVVTLFCMAGCKKEPMMSEKSGKALVARVEKVEASQQSLQDGTAKLKVDSIEAKKSRVGSVEAGTLEVKEAIVLGPTAVVKTPSHPKGIMVEPAAAPFDEKGFAKKVADALDAKIALEKATLLADLKAKAEADAAKAKADAEAAAKAKADADAAKPGSTAGIDKLLDDFIKTKKELLKEAKAMGKTSERILKTVDPAPAKPKPEKVKPPVKEDEAKMAPPRPCIKYGPLESAIASVVIPIQKNRIRHTRADVAKAQMRLGQDVADLNVVPWLSMRWPRRDCL